MRVCHNFRENTNIRLIKRNAFIHPVSRRNIQPPIKRDIKIWRLWMWNHADIYPWRWWRKLWSFCCPGNASTVSGNGELAGRNSVWDQWTRSCTYEGLFPLCNYTVWGLLAFLILLIPMLYSCSSFMTKSLLFVCLSLLF